MLHLKQKLETQQGFTNPLNSYGRGSSYPTNWNRGNIPMNYYGNWETNQQPANTNPNTNNDNISLNNTNDQIPRTYENRRGSSGYRNRQRRDYDSNGTGNNRRGGGRNYNRGYQGNKDKESNNNSRKRGGSGSGKTLQLGAADFPPLPSQTQTITPGYSTQFQKFTKEEMIKILHEISDFPKQDDLLGNSSNDFKIFLSEPSLEIECLKTLPKKVTALEIATKAQEINNSNNQNKTEGQKTPKSEK